MSKKTCTCSCMCKCAGTSGRICNPQDASTQSTLHTPPTSTPVSSTPSARGAGRVQRYERPKSAGSGIPQPISSIRNGSKPPQSSTRPRTAGGIAKKPKPNTTQRPMSSGYSAPNTTRSHIPQIRKMPTVVLNTKKVRGNNLQINIRLTMDPEDSDVKEAKELEEFEYLERELAELEEFEKLEKQCEIEYGTAQIFDVIPITPQYITGRRKQLQQSLFDVSTCAQGTLRGARREQERFESIVGRAGHAPNIAATSPPPFESPASLNTSGWSRCVAAAEGVSGIDACSPALCTPVSLDNVSGWNRLQEQTCPMLMDESMLENMLDDTFDEAWSRLATNESTCGLGIESISISLDSTGGY